MNYVYIKKILTTISFSKLSINPLAVDEDISKLVTSLQQKIDELQQQLTKKDRSVTLCSIENV